MAKASGGTRNYANNEKALNTRKTEFSKLMGSGDYDKSRSMFDSSGGFVATHKDHNKVAGPNKNGEKLNMEDVAAELLAKKGYKIYLDSEKGTIAKVKMPDGRVYKMRMDIKTINNAGEYTIENALRQGVNQIVNFENTYKARTDKHAIVLYQNTKSMTKEYVLDQINNFKNNCTKDKSKAWMLRQLDVVIVVGESGNIHRHFIK